MRTRLVGLPMLHHCQSHISVVPSVSHGCEWDGHHICVCRMSLFARGRHPAAGVADALAGNGVRAVVLVIVSDTSH